MNILPAQLKSILNPRILCLGLICLGLLLGGCQSGISLSYSPPATADTAFDYYQKIRSLSDTENMEEVSKIQSEFDMTGDASLAVKLAVLFSWREQSGKEQEDAAIALLQQTLMNPQTSPLASDYRRFAEQWLELLHQRQKSRTTTLLLTQTQESLEQLRLAYGQLDERYLGLARVLAALEQQNSLLAAQNMLMQKQIEALTVIEQQLAEREQLQAKP